MKQGYVCDNCGKFTESAGGPYLDSVTEAKPWACPICGKEACAGCFWKYGAHKKCCEGKTDTELIAIANSEGFDFEPVPELTAAGREREEGE